VKIYKTISCTKYFQITSDYILVIKIYFRENMSPKPQVLSNVELIVLETILEMESISGYDLNRLIEERQFREWAEIGTTSIYLALKKLEKKEFVSWVLDKKKSGKGPPARKFSITNKGKKVLTNEILHSLSQTDERDKRFDIAFYGIGFLPRVIVVLAIEKRIEYLVLKFERLEDISNLKINEGLPLHKKNIIDHRMVLISNEIEFMNRLLEQLRNREIEI